MYKKYALLSLLLPYLCLQAMEQKEKNTLANDVVQ